MSKKPNSHLRNIAVDNAKAPWGIAWDKLTEDHQEALEALVAREALMLLMGQCDSLDKYDPAKDLIRTCMGWDD